MTTAVEQAYRHMIDTTQDWVTLAELAEAIYRNPKVTDAERDGLFLHIDVAERRIGRPPAILGMG